MRFELYRRPGGVVLLDDDQDYIESLSEVMPPDWHIQLFTRPKVCISQLLEESAKAECDVWRHHEMVRRWREGASLISQMLDYWRDDKINRFAFTQVLVIDYQMPAMNGLRVLSELSDWGGARILLSGHTDDKIALSAFNRGLINQYVAKSEDNFLDHLIQSIQQLKKLQINKHQQIWRLTFSSEKFAALCSPGIVRDIDRLAKENQWIEYVVVGSPFGVLALDKKGAAYWMQLGATRKPIDIATRSLLGSCSTPQCQNAFVLGDPTEQLHAEIIKIQESFCPGAANHEKFLALNGENEQLQT